MQMIIAASLLLSLSSFLMAGDRYKWKRVYEDDEVAIDMDTSKVTLAPNRVGRVTFRWTWAKPHMLRMTPGVAYKSRIETTEVDCAKRRFHTAGVKLFDVEGNALRSDGFIASPKWDTVKPGGIMGEVFDAACELIASKRQ